MSQEYAELAQRHLQHDLTTSDRQVLESAAKKFGLYSTIGASVGLGLGLFLSLRIRRAGQVFYNAAKKAEKPTAIQFADGHTGEPNQILSGLFFGLGGFFVGGEIGLLVGSASASRTVSADPTSRARIESAFRQFRIDVLRKQADDLEKQSRPSLAL
ncbi:hypothetical protein EMMF5_001087 [Cystobasidiomycetes sp. EMM_F5]